MSPEIIIALCPLLLQVKKDVDENVKIWYHINTDKKRVSVYPATRTIQLLVFLAFSHRDREREETPKQKHSLLQRRGREAEFPPIGELNVSDLATESGIKERDVLLRLSASCRHC